MTNFFKGSRMKPVKQNMNSSKSGWIGAPSRSPTIRITAQSLK